MLLLSGKFVKLSRWNWDHCFGTFSWSLGPFSKSAVNYHAGCKTPMSNAVMSVCMILVLMFLAPLFKHTPLVALAVIIIVAMLGVIELHEIRHLFRVDKFDFCLCMAAFLGVLFVNMKTGLAISVRIENIYIYL